MPGPSTTSTTNQTRGPATPEETSFSGIATLDALGASLAGRQARTDPRAQLATLSSQVAELRRRAEAKAEWDRTGGGGIRNLMNDNYVGGAYAAAGPNWTASRDNARAEIAELEQQAQQLEAQRPLLEQQAARLTGTEGMEDQARTRIMDVLMGRDLGVSPQEQQLITQGISGISQDVATTRGLNRSDVPVMQAVAPAVSNALLQQANANRSLFTGINQFQQGMGLSGRQLQAGLAGQNPAANLTGVYAGLRPSSFSTNTQQGYGALDYVNATANLAKGIGSAATGGADAGLWG